MAINWTEAQIKEVVQAVLRQMTPETPVAEE